MSSQSETEVLEPAAGDHAPPTVLLLFTIGIGFGVMAAGIWVFKGNVLMALLGVLGVLLGVGGLKYARHL